MNQTNFRKYAPWCAAGLTLLYFAFYMLPARDRDDSFHYHAFGRLMAIDGGRLKPMDTVARMNLMVITHRQQMYIHDPEKLRLIHRVDEEGPWKADGRMFATYEEAADAVAPRKYYPATKWLLDTIATPHPQDAHLTRLYKPKDEDEAKKSLYGEAWNYKIFRIENDEVLRMLNLKMRDGLRYSLLEIVPSFDVIMQEVRRINGDEESGVKGVDPKKLTLRDAKILELFQHLNLYMKISSQNVPLVIPDPEGTDQWKSFRAYLQEIQESGRPEGEGVDTRTFTVLARLSLMHTLGKKAEFNKLLHEHLAELERTEPTKMRAIDVEIFFNNFAPFYHCLVIYVFVAILGGLSWLLVDYSEPLRRSAYAMMGIAFVAHLSGLIIRMYLQDRMFVFVTNLYSSAVFIGLGCVLVCLLVEYFYKNGIGIVVGSVTGFCTLIIAHMLSLSGDTLEMMQAVLDTNFWLATHVTCITLGYTTAFVAGGMGIAYILLGLFTNMLRKEGSANLTRMTYGVLCTGMFLSFVGTVLGGLWADYSWGRFWGWDPKENGALLIVLWIALILHARWGGMVKHRGIAVLSVLGIVVTSWSWFGTNFLGVGLHAYGGAKVNAMAMLVGIDLIFIAIAGLGMIPLHHWQSFKPLSTVTLPPEPLKPKARMA
jgi:ABC-type transport system involved in cytochrome c biogenesis permease subunit